MQNITHIRPFKGNSFRNEILVENNITLYLNPFRDEISSSNSIFYFVPTALFGWAKILSTNILSLAGQVMLMLMRFYFGNYRINKLKPVNFVNPVKKNKQIKSIKMIKNSTFYLMLLQLIFLQTFTDIKATNLKLIMYNHTAMQGSQVIVPIRVADFNSILSIQGSIEFDPSIVSYYSTEQYGLTGMSASNFGVTQAGNGKITFSWFDASMSGQTLSDSAIIFAIKFNVIGNNGQQTALNFTGSPTALEFVNSSLTAIPYTLVNGSVSVSNSSLGVLKIMADNVTSPQGSQVVVPIRVSDFNNVLSMQGSISFSTSVATFISVEQFNLAGMSSASFGTSQSGSGILTFSWFDQTLAGQSVSDSSVIFAIRFQLTGSSGSQTSVDFTDSPTNLEFTDNSYVTFPYTASSGSITISNTISGGLTFYPDSVFTPTLTQVQVPIKTTGFSALVSIQGTIEFDTSIATYSSISQFGLSGMDINNFGTSQTSSGKLTFSWLDGTLAGQSLTDSSSVFTIVFDVIGNPGEYTIIKFSNNPTALEFVDTSLVPISAQLDSGGIYIELPYSINTDSISADSICDGLGMIVYYSTPNNYNSGNIFTAQLSDSDGNFTTYTEIGNVTNTVSGYINAIIPQGTTTGTNYKIRVVSSNPAIIGNDNGYNIVILQNPNQPQKPLGQGVICQNSINTDFTINRVSNATSYNWQLFPTTAGIISGTDTIASVNWDSTFTGNAYIFVAAENGICTSQFSDSLIVTVSPVYATMSQVEICDDNSYIFGTQTLTASGTYFDTLTSINGCDSIITLNLTVNPTYLILNEVEVCEGDSYIFGTQTLTTSGTYYDTLQSSLGCDSILQLQLTLIGIQYSTSDVAICDGSSYLFGSQPLTTAGIYYDTLTSSLGCDSIITLNLTVNPIYSILNNVEICEGDSYAFGINTLTTSGTYYDTLQSSLGCDSILQLQLSVISIQYSTSDIAICDGSSYLFGSQLLTTTGIYYDTLTSSFGCDSIITLNLTVNPIYAILNDVEICEGDSYVLGTQILTSNGTYTETFQTLVGCDSVVTINLTINPTYTFMSNAEVCNGDSYTLPDGLIVTSSGTYTSAFVTNSGCDSTIVTNLTVNQTYNYTTDVQICNGNSYQLPDGTTANTDGTYTSNLTSEFGCDSIIITNLSLVSEIINNVSVAICEGESYFAQGAWQTSSGTYYDTTLSVFGCDSIIVSQLSVISIQYSVISDSVCDGDSYLFDSQQLNASGTYYDTLISSAGCDSIITLNLTVNPTYLILNEVEICNGYSYTLPDGAVVYVSGTYTIFFTTISGCDSIIITELSVNPVFSIANEVELCNGSSYQLPDGIIINATGTYISNLTTSLGCDSIISTQVTVIDEIINNIPITICEGDSIFAGGNWQYSNGLYYDTLVSVAGCDSIMITDLSIQSLPIVDIGDVDSLCYFFYYPDSIVLDAGNTGASYIWSTGDSTQIVVIQWGSLIPYVYNTITVAVSYGTCTVIDSVLLWTDICENVDIIDNIINFNIYPNPATNEVFIEIPNNLKLQTTNNKLFKLFSIEGKKVLEGTLESPKTRISTKDLEGGIYFIEVNIENEKVNSKLVITK